MNALSCATLGDVLRFHARHRPDKPAFETAGGASVTFGQFNSRVNRLCSALGQWGLRKGDRVAVLSRNRPEYVEVFGVAKAGLVAVPLNWRLAEAELVKLLAHSAPQVLIVDETYKEVAERLRSLLPDLRHFVLLGPEGAGREYVPGSEDSGWTGYEDLLRQAADDEPEALVAPGDALCLVYTSGTTGAPKGVTLTHRGLLDNCNASATDVMALTEDDYSLAVLPLFHVGGMWYHLFPCFAAGCTTLLMAEFEPGALLRELQARKVTNVHVVPTMINAMLNHPLAATADLSHLRLIFYAASSMPAELLRRAMQCFSRSGFVQSYGSTEAGMVTVLSVADHLRASKPAGEHLLSSCGRVLKERRVRIVDDAGTELGVGEIGAISSYCPGVMAGYWHDADATAKVLQDGWLDTGDLGYLDGEGYLYLVDRKNDMVVTGGENVYPSEVEACFYQDPAVLEAAVFGVADPRWVERVVAAVVLRPGFEADEQALMQRIRSHLAAYKCPKNIFFTTDLPKSGAGKVLRKELRKKYGASEL
ncbi:class I adenylate-forming enzyme family protein [Eoetvoesiella caeni]